MAQIKVTNLTYCYEGSFDNVFEDVSFSIDTNWKLGVYREKWKREDHFFEYFTGKI